MNAPVSSPAARWFRQIWPRRSGLDAVLADYQTVSGLKHFLTDLALRGGVFTVFPSTAVDLFEAGRREGRRELALEIIRIAQENPVNLYRYIEKAGVSE